MDIGKIKALSVRQPWAWALFHGKPVENRSWKTKHRGPTFIHASKTFDRDGYNWIIENLDRLRLDAPLPALGKFERGGIIGIVNHISVVSGDWSSPWFFGPYGFVFTNPTPLDLIPCPGKLKLFLPDWFPGIGNRNRMEILEFICGRDV